MYYEDQSVLLGIGAWVWVMITLAISLIIVIGYWKLFEKAGEEGWKALIPIYNVYIMFKIAWGSGIMFLLLFIPVVNVIVEIILQFKIARAFGRGDAYALGLFFLPYIFYPALGFGDAEYIGPDGRQQNVYIINQYNYNGEGAPINIGSDAPAAKPAQSHRPARKSAYEPVRERAYEPACEPVYEPTNDSVYEPASEPARESAYAPANEAAYAPANESAYAPANAIKYCPHCGAQISEKAIFCEFCGEHVDKPQLEKTLIAERTPVDFGENTEILLDDPVIIGPTLRLISEEASTVNGANDISVPATPFVIGRSTANADHAIDARGISRKHVQIDLEDGIYYITDLNSTNGVLINGSRISPMERTILEKDDTIKIGERVYRVEFSYSHEQRAAV